MVKRKGKMEMGRSEGSDMSVSVKPPDRRRSHCPTLSVILLSTGDRMTLERALEAIAGRCRRLDAEIVVVRSNLSTDASTLSAAYPCVEFLDVAVGTSGADMREVGTNYASGDIISLRVDVAVGDGGWLDAFDSTVGSLGDVVRMDQEIPMVVVPGDLPSSVENRHASVYSAPSVSALPKRRLETTSRAHLPVELDEQRAPTDSTTRGT